MNPLQAISDCKILVIVGHRGYGKSFLAAQLKKFDYASNLRDPSFIIFDNVGSESARSTLSIATAMDRAFRKYGAATQVKVFLRTEYWLRVRNYPEHVWLSQNGHVHTLYPKLDLPSSSMSNALSNSYGHVVPWAFNHCITLRDTKNISEAQAIKEAQFAFCALQPESPVLAEIVHAASNRVPYRRALNIINNLPTKPLVQSSSAKFIEHCEVIGALKRIRNATLEISPLWLAGCRQIQYDL